MADIYELTHRLRDVDLVEGQGTQGTRILPPPHSLGYINDPEDLNSSKLTSLTSNLNHNFITTQFINFSITY